MKHISSLPNPSSLLESMRDIGYSMETAIADLIDNCITAKAKNISIKYSWNSGNPWLAILDDGSGMTSGELIQAMALGSKNPLEKRDALDLGRYGLGLKTASFSQARKLTVISKKENEVSGCEWDLDQIHEGWNLGVLDKTDIDSVNLVGEIRKTGTLVLWQKLDRLGNFDQELVRERKLSSLIATSSKHIELTFHRFLSPLQPKDKINITFNSRQLEAFNPFNPSSPATIELSEQKIYVGNEAITVQPYVLPHYNKVSRVEYEKFAGESGYLQNQGFYVYRNKRLIIKSTWFRLIPREELTKLLRVQIDIPNTLDQMWKIDIKKADASPPEAIRTQLRQIVFQIQHSGKEVYKRKGTLLKSKVSEPAWNRVAANGKITYEINKSHPVITKLIDILDEEQQRKIVSVLAMLESSFPAELFYCDLAKQPEAIAKPVFDIELYSSMLDEFIVQMRWSKVADSNIPTRLLSIDPFATYPEEVKKLLQQKGIDCE